MNHLHKALLFIFSLLPLYADAQTRYLDWVDPKSALRERIEIRSAQRSAEDTDGNWRLKGKTNISAALLEDWQTFEEKNYYFNLKHKPAVWFTINGSQRVYELDLLNNNLKRIDQTHYAGYNFNATQFLRKDTLYSGGGYGFWQFHSLLTYFNEGTKEWELVRTTGEGPVAILGGYQGYDPMADLLYSGGGQVADKKSDADKAFEEHFFSFDFKTLSWKKLGEINSMLNLPHLREVLWTGRYFLSADQNQLFIVDPNLNKIYSYVSKKDNFHKIDSYYVKGDTLFAYLDNNAAITRFSIHALLKRSEEVGPFYIANPFLNWLYGFPIGMLAIGLGFYYRKYWKKKSALSDSSFTTYEVRLINALCQTEFLTANDITDLLDLQSKSIENQRKIRMNLINHINDKIEKKLAVSNAIERIDDAQDKRIKLFFIRAELKPLFKNLA